MSLPTDFHHEVAERVDQPGFDVVLDRARAGRRRRRTTVAAGLAAACVVGVLATWGSGLRATDAPEPAGPTRTPTTSPTPLTGEVDERLPEDVREILSAERIDPWVVSGSGGATAVVWADCTGERCRHALVTRIGDRFRGRVLPTGTYPFVQAVPGGWLLEGEDGFVRVTPDGDEQTVLDPGGNAYDVQSGDTAVQTADGWRLLRGDKLVAVPSPGGDVLGAYVTPTGRLVVAAELSPGITVSASDDGRAWETTLTIDATGLIASAVVAGHVDDVAVALLGDDPDGSIPVEQVSVSTDAGATWESASGRELPFGGAGGLADLNGLAVSDEGTAWLTAGTTGLVRVDADANVLATRLSSRDRSAFLVSHRVCVVTEQGRVDTLTCSDDDGTTWAPQSLPGFG